MTETRTTSSTGGEKGVKPQRYDLIPIHPLNLLAELYGKGAEKYAAHNFRKGYEWSKSYAAAMRHMTAFWNGEDIDPEMGVPHVICAAFHMFALAEFMEFSPDFDDRYVRGETEAAEEESEIDYNSSIDAYLVGFDDGYNGRPQKQGLFENFSDTYLDAYRAGSNLKVAQDEKENPSDHTVGPYYPN